jgi:cytochrome c oxidase cbb3-type subunit 3
MLCATCHGEDGCTAGPGAAGLDPLPAHHCDGNYMNKLSDEHIFKVIKEGGASVGKSPLMAAWGGALSDDQIHDVVAFVRSLAKPPYPGK